MAILVVDLLEAVQIKHVDGQHFVFAAASNGSGNGGIDDAPVGQAGERVGVRQRMQGIALQFGLARGQFQLLGLQAEHPHEEQHVYRGTKLERMHGPEVGRHRAFDDFDQHVGGYKIDEPGRQKVPTHAIAPAGAVNGAGQTQQRGCQAQRADDGGHLLDVKPAHGVAETEEHHQAGAGPHQPAHPGFHVCALQGLLDEKKRAGGSQQGRKASDMQFYPVVVRPKKLPAHAKMQQ